MRRPLRDVSVESCPTEDLFRPLSMKELLEGDHGVEFEIDGMLVARQPCAILGATKAMKTTLMLNLALSLATGGRFLGRFQCKNKRRVCVMSGESGLGTIKETLLRQCAAEHITLADVETLFVEERLPQLKSDTHLDAIWQTLTRLQIECLIIDPLYLCIETNGQESSIYAMGAAISGISQICQELGISLFLVHHLKRSTKPYKAGDLQDASWAGVSEFSRQWFVVNRREAYKRGSGIHRLWMSGGGSAGHSFEYLVDIDEGISPNRHWRPTVRENNGVGESELDGTSNRGARGKQERNKDGLKRIVDALAKFPGGETKNSLSIRLGINGGKVNALIGEALSLDLIEECSIVKSGKKSKAYRLIEETDKAQ